VVITPIYFLFLLFTLGTINVLRLLVFLEILSWLFVLLLPFTSSFNYLIIQRYFLLLRLTRLVIIPSLLVICFFIKLGLPPFHMWFLRISGVSRKGTFLFIITIHKLLPILFLEKIIFGLVSFLMLIFSVLVVGLILVRRRTIFFTLVFSSILNRVWILLRGFLGKGFILFFWLFYRLLLILLLSLVGFDVIREYCFNQRIITRRCWLLMSGIPPFMIFWLKLHALIWLISSLGLIIRLVILIFSVVALTSYYRTWHFGSLIESRHLRLGGFRGLILVLGFWGAF